MINNMTKERGRSFALLIMTLVMCRYIVQRNGCNHSTTTYVEHSSLQHGIFEVIPHKWTVEYIGPSSNRYVFIEFGFTFDMGRRGPKAKVSPPQAIEVLKKYMRYFTTDELPACSSQVWIDMSIDFGGKWTPACVYTNVREDRHNILTTARMELGIIIPSNELQASNFQQSDRSDLVNSSDSSSSIITEKENSSSSVASYDEQSKGTSKFELLLSSNDWCAIKPGLTEDGKKYVLTQKVWTNIIAIECWKQHKLPCAFNFKRADVAITPDGSSYRLKIVGYCKSDTCGNTFIGRATKNRCDDGGIVIHVETRDTRNEKHAEVKRHLNGKRRRDIQKELISEGCAVWKKRNAREYMKIGDLVPPFVPSNDVLKRAKKEGVDAEVDAGPEDARDLIETIEALLDTEKYAGLIQDVGSRPFFTFYGTPEQMHSYNEYCRVMKDASLISIDATGSLITKLKRPGNQTSGHIFLYSVVINFENTTLPVYQMISEKHVTETITYWLRTWIRLGARKPKEAVCDYSRALISAICMSMNNITIKSYINHCFVSVRDGRRSDETMSTLIRIDVAHLIHLVCRWKSLQGVRRSQIKDFFVRCVALMIECQTLAEFSEILTLTCAVGLQEYDDTKIALPGAQTTREERKRLEDIISVRCCDTEFAELRNAGDSQSSDDREDAVSTDTPIGIWVQAQKDRAKESIRDGTELNPFFLPDFVDQLVGLAKEFPLWTAVTMPYEASHATSAYVEGYFNDLKTRVLKNHPRPMRVDTFLKKHAMDITGGSILFSAKLVGFERRSGSIPSLKPKKINEATNLVTESSAMHYAAANDSDLLSQENWRAKAKNEDFEEEPVFGGNLSLDALVFDSGLLLQTQKRLRIERHK